VNRISATALMNGSKQTSEILAFRSLSATQPFPLVPLILKYFVNGIRDLDGHEELLVGNGCRRTRRVNVSRSHSSVSSSVL